MPEGTAGRPWTVALGCAVSLAISIWDIVSSMPDEEIAESPAFVAIVVSLSLIPALFTLAAFHRRNWARIAVAIITALGLVSIPLLTLFWEEMAGPWDAETALYTLAEIVVIVLLFAPASNEWYRHQPSAAVAPSA